MDEAIVNKLFFRPDVELDSRRVLRARVCGARLRKSVTPLNWYIFIQTITKEFKGF